MKIVGIVTEPELCAVSGMFHRKPDQSVMKVTKMRGAQKEAVFYCRVLTFRKDKKFKRWYRWFSAEMYI